MGEFSAQMALGDFFFKVVADLEASNVLGRPLEATNSYWAGLLKLVVLDHPIFSSKVIYWTIRFPKPIIYK